MDSLFSRLDQMEGRKSRLEDNVDVLEDSDKGKK
jgi:hypothetical protein